MNRVIQRKSLLLLSAAVLFTVSAHAIGNYDVDPELANAVLQETAVDQNQGGDRSEAPTESVALDIDEEINQQILCLKKTRLGTRIATRRCQSVAAWKTEIAGEYIKRYLLEM